MPSLTKWKIVPPAAPRVTLLVRHDEHRRVERRLLRPRMLAGVEHSLAHHARAGALERLPDDVVVAPLFAALAELQVLPKEPLRNIHCCSSIHCCPINSSTVSVR